MSTDRRQRVDFYEHCHFWMELPMTRRQEVSNSLECRASPRSSPSEQTKWLHNAISKGLTKPLWQGQLVTPLTHRLHWTQWSDAHQHEEYNTGVGGTSLWSQPSGESHSRIDKFEANLGNIDYFKKTYEWMNLEDSKIIQNKITKGKLQEKQKKQTLKHRIAVLFLGR